MKLTTFKTILAAALCAVGLAAFADQDPVSYLDWNGKELFETNTTDYVHLTKDTEVLAEGTTYVVADDITVPGRLSVNGNPQHPSVLILCDGASLMAKGGIRVQEKGATTNALVICGQAQGTGVLETTGTSPAGIGGDYQESCGAITINGGTVVAKGSGGAGIGGGDGGNGGSCGTITINGGTVTATGSAGAGIGAGRYNRKGNGTIVINGGSVTATSSSGAGIGGGSQYMGSANTFGSVKIYGGTVNASSSTGEAIGRGEGSTSTGDVVEIYSGSVGGVLIGEDADTAIYLVATNEYAVGLGAGVAVFPRAVARVPQSAGVVYTVSNAQGQVEGILADGTNTYAVTPGDSLEVYFSLMPGCDWKTPPAVNPIKVEDITFVSTVDGAALPTAQMPSVKYLDWDAEKKELFETEITDYIEYDGWTKLDGGKTYVVNRDFKTGFRVTASGEEKNPARLVLCDGTTLTTKKGIAVGTSEVDGICVTNALVICGQEGGTGVLAAPSAGRRATVCIGGEDGGSVTINGGTVTAGGGRPSADGIGGTVTINEGVVETGFGIYGVVTINGGTVTSSGEGSGVGFGGFNDDGGILTVNGGTVTAGGERVSVGIGGFNAGGIVTVNGGVVTARGMVGIGCCREGSGGSLTVNGGEVTAIGDDGAGIGCGERGAGGVVTINGGTVTATGGDSGAGIGGGRESSGGTVTINGGTVIATSGEGNAAGIGNGADCHDGSCLVTINGGEVIAQGRGMVSIGSESGDPPGVIFKPGVKFGVVVGSEAPGDTTMSSEDYAMNGYCEYPYAHIQVLVPGCEGDPWPVGDGVSAWTNGTELVIVGEGTVPSIAGVDGLKDLLSGLTAVAIRPNITDVTPNAFEGIPQPFWLTLPDGWQGDLPDKDGNWYGMKVRLTALPRTIRDVRFQQRYPWNGLVDLGFTQTSPLAGEAKAVVTVYRGGTEAVTNFPVAVSFSATGVFTTNIVWDATSAGYGDDFLANDFSVTVESDFPARQVTVWKGSKTFEWWGDAQQIPYNWNEIAPGDAVIVSYTLAEGYDDAYIRVDASWWGGLPGVTNAYPSAADHDGYIVVDADGEVRVPLTDEDLELIRNWNGLSIRSEYDHPFVLKQVSLAVRGRMSRTSPMSTLDLRSGVKPPDATVSNVTYSATCWGAVDGLSTALGYTNVTFGFGGTLKSVSGEGVTDVTLPPYGGEYRLTHATGRLTSFVTFAVDGLTNCTVHLPAALAEYGYVVSNLTTGARIEAVSAAPGGADYELPFGAKIAIWCVPNAGYEKMPIIGENPYVIEKVSPTTTVSEADLPKVLVKECTVVVRNGGKLLGEPDPSYIATNFTIEVVGYDYTADDFAGYCVRAKGEAAGEYAVSFRFTRIPDGFDESDITVLPGAFTITDSEDIVAQWAAADRAAGYPANGYAHVRLGCDPTMGKVKGEKVYKLKYDKKTGVSSAKVSISATAAKGYVFAGWYLDPGFSQPATFWTGSGKSAKPKDYREASQSMTVTDNTYLFARFVEKTTTADPISWLRYAGAGYCGADASWLAEEETWYQGVALPTNGCAVAFGSLSLPTVTVSGLPAGVKFDKTTCRFTGVPTAASTEKKPFFTVKVTVKNKSGANDVLVKNVYVKPLPAWAVGSFDGYHMEEGVTNGTFAATVGKTGKVSGKTKGGLADTSFSAKNFSEVFTLDGTNLIYAVDVTVSYKDPSTKKTVKQVDTLYLMEDAWTGLGTIGGGDEDGCGSVGVQCAWDRKDLAYPAFDTKNGGAGIKTPLEFNNGLKLKFGAKGKVTVSGVVPGDNLSPVKASGTTYVLPLLWTDEGYTNLVSQTCVYVAPKKNLATGFCEVYDLMLEAEESGTKIEAVRILSPEDYSDYTMTGKMPRLPPHHTPGGPSTH